MTIAGGGRTISRANLIAIAKKKQARGMMSAYNACKAKLQKCKDTRLKKTPLGTEAVCGMRDKGLMKIKAIDTTAWPEADSTHFALILIRLKT